MRSIVLFFKELLDCLAHIDDLVANVLVGLLKDKPWYAALEVWEHHVAESGLIGFSRNSFQLPASNLNVGTDHILDLRSKIISVDGHHDNIDRAIRSL